MNSKIRVLIFALLAVPLFVACETEEDRTLAEAQMCINTATSANVDACIAKVAGMESEDAYLIRCSANFIAQGFTESRLSSAFSNIKGSNSASGVTPTTTALAYLVFNNALTSHTVTISKLNCERSGATSLYRILKLVEVATLLGPAVNPASPTAADDMKAAIGAFAGDTTALGNMAISLREDFCVNNTSFASTDICTKVNQAYTTGGGNAATIGNAIKDLLD